MVTKKKNGTVKKPAVKPPTAPTVPPKSEPAAEEQPKKPRAPRKPMAVQPVKVDVVYRGKPTKADMFEATHNGQTEVFATRKEGNDWIKERRTTNKTPTYAKICRTHYNAWQKLAETVPEGKLEVVSVLQSALIELARPYVDLTPEPVDDDTETDIAPETASSNPLSRLGTMV